MTAHFFSNFQHLHGDALHQIKTPACHCDGPATAATHTQTHTHKQRESHLRRDKKKSNQILMQNSSTAVQIHTRVIKRIMLSDAHGAILNTKERQCCTPGWHHSKDLLSAAQRPAARHWRRVRLVPTWGSSSSGGWSWWWGSSRTCRRRCAPHFDTEGFQTPRTPSPSRLGPAGPEASCTQWFPRFY